MARNAGAGWGLLALGAWMVLGAQPATAQSDVERQTLRAQIERRFDVLPVQGGVVLTPKRGNRDVLTVRAIQITGGDIAIDGDPVTGADLRRRLGGDAEVVIRLSYLDAREQRALFGGGGADAVPPGPPEAPQPPDVPRGPRPPRRPGGGSDRVRVGGGVQVMSGEVVTGDVVAIGGDANVDGQVLGDVVVIGGGAELGPHADVLRDVTVVGGTLRRDPAARVGGGVHEIGWGNLRFPPFGSRLPVRGFLGGAIGSLFLFMTTVVRLFVLCVLASIVLLFGREYVERIGTRAAAEPVKAGLVGLLIQLLFVPVLIVTIVVLVVTIIGIPLLALVPVALVALAILFLVGFTAVTYDVGRFAAMRFGWQESSPYLVAALGILIVLSPFLLGRLVGFTGALLIPIAWTLLLLGFLVEYAAWTVGLGAIALTRFDRR